MIKTATLVLGAALLLGAAANETFTGVITDTMCGAGHKMMNVTPDAKCVRDCVKAGYKYALYDGKNVYTLSDQQTPEKYAAQTVKVVGTLHPKTKIIAVESIQAVK